MNQSKKEKVSKAKTSKTTQKEPKAPTKTAAKKNIKTKGGQLMGEGVAGCTFSPPITCVDGRAFDNNYVSKIFDSEHDSSDDIISANLLSPIDPFQETMLFALSGCTVNVNNITNEDKRNCSMMKKAINQKPLESIIMKKGGVTWEKFWGRGGEGYSQAHPINILLYIWRVLEAIRRLQMNNLVHIDIKPDNIIMMREEDNTTSTRLIDFGLMDTYPDFRPDTKEMFRNVKEAGSFVPPEVRILAANANTRSTQARFIEQELNNHCIGAYMINKYSDFYRKSYERLWVRSKSGKTSLDKYINQISFNRYYDIYCLGTVLSEARNDHVVVEDYDRDMFDMLILKMTAPFEQDRWDIIEVMAYVYQYVKSRANASFMPATDVHGFTTLHPEFHLSTWPEFQASGVHRTLPKPTDLLRPFVTQKQIQIPNDDSDMMTDGGNKKRSSSKPKKVVSKTKPVPDKKK